MVKYHFRNILLDREVTEDAVQKISLRRETQLKLFT